MNCRGVDTGAVARWFSFPTERGGRSTSPFNEPRPWPFALSPRAPPHVRRSPAQSAQGRAQPSLCSAKVPGSQGPPLGRAENPGLCAPQIRIPDLGEFYFTDGETRPDVDDVLGTSRSRRFPSGPRPRCWSSACSREAPQAGTCARGRCPRKGTHRTSQRPHYNIDWHQPVSRIMEIM